VVRAAGALEDYAPVTLYHRPRKHRPMIRTRAERGLLGQPAAQLWR